MSELSEVQVQNSSPACYTIEDDDEPEVIFISDNTVMSEEDSRDGEPFSTTSGVNGDDREEGRDTANVSDNEIVENDTQQETSKLSDASDEDEGSGNVLNDCIKLIDLVKSYEKVDKTIKTKFKDGFIFLENLQTQFEDTERNITEKDEMIAKLIAENSKLKEDHKQLKGEMSTQSLQFGMLKNKYVQLEEELKGLKINENIEEEPTASMLPVPMPKNMSLETMKSKADKLQKLFRQLCSKMSEERVIKSDPESVKKSKELKSFQNEVGVLFIKVQHKLSKWVKNQVKMEEELERCRMLLETLDNMATFESQMKTLTPPPTVAVVESSIDQHGSKKRKIPLPPLVPLHIPILNNSKCNSGIPVTSIPQKDNSSSTSMSVPNELSMISSHSTALESGTLIDGISPTKSIDFKTIPVPSTFPAVYVQPSPTQAIPSKPSPPSTVPTPSARSSVLIMKSPILPTAPMQSSPHLASTFLSEMKTSETSRISPPLCSPSLYQLPPLPALNFPMSPPKSVVFPPKSVVSPPISSEQVVNPILTVPSSVKSKAPKVQSPETKPKVRRRRAKSLKTTPTHSPQMTSAESRYSLTPPQYSQALYPVHPQHNSYALSQGTPNGLHQATPPAFNNQMTQIPFSAAKFLPQQQHQITSSSPPVSTQNIMSPSASIPETKTPTNVTPQNKCLVCAMAFATPIQLKLHHAVVHSNKTPSSALSGLVATSPPTFSPSTSHQPGPLFAPPPPLQERHQNSTSLQRIPSIGQTLASTNTSIGTTTTTWSTNEPNQKRHCSGLSPLTSVLPSNSIPRSAHVSPVPINKNSMNNSVNFTQPYDNNNLFSFLDLL